MNEETKKAARKLLTNDFKNFETLYLNTLARMRAMATQYKDYMQDLAQTITNPNNAHRVMPKTPRVKKRFNTIVEEVKDEKFMADSEEPKSSERKEDYVAIPKRTTGRPKRGASMKADANIKTLQSLTLNKKLRRPSSPRSENSRCTQTTQSKRIVLSSSESDDESLGRKPAKQYKKDVCTKVPVIQIKSEPMSLIEEDEEMSLRAEGVECMEVVNEKKTQSIVRDSITEPSMYEDALTRPGPMSSTMNPNDTMTLDKKIMNSTVVLYKMNETVTISKPSVASKRNKMSTESTSSVSSHPDAVRLQKKMSAMKATTPAVDELITDDESSATSPEKTMTPKKFARKSSLKNHQPSAAAVVVAPAAAIVVSDSDEEVISSPEKSPVKSKLKYKKELSKNRALFSPYSKESVKKRVEAFEKAAKDKSEDDDEVENGGRVTRTKTRALAKNNNVEITKPNVAKVTLARKSLAKAKKISIAKQNRENEEKENAESNAGEKIKALRVVQKQLLKATPASKSKLKVPLSASKIPSTPVNKPMITRKVNTASKVTSINSSTESKGISKSTSTESLADKRHKVVHSEEGAKRKKEEALKAQTEERRRKREEKEMKIKQAREARERAEQEKRMKLEKEKEEKARMALVLQEKLREEAERKKIAQAQRALEKEEKRRREEQSRQLRIQEQQELERRLADQKRREQEAERRKLAEARMQQLADAEAAKLKQQYEAKIKAMNMKHQEELNGPANYKIDSDPDDDDSDNEARPKHAIPYWAQKHVRQAQLEAQQHIPIQSVLKYFGAKKSTPNLAEFFVGIKKERLKRTSSAVWKTPPRYSMMEED